jgi:N-sulfoglucosamine sulfohydrolase
MKAAGFKHQPVSLFFLKMRRYDILILIILAVPFRLRAQQKYNQNRPNILWITCEDLSPHFGCYGDTLVKTPNIDRLAREGMRYTRMCATAGVCAPSRAALITGQYQTSNGTHHMRTLGYGSAGNRPPGIAGYSRVLSPEVKCYPEYLRAAGYYCTNNDKTDYQFEPPLSAWDASNKKAHWRNRPDPTQPFFAVFNLTVSHESQVWNRAKEPLTIDPAKVNVPPYYHDSPVVRQDIARFLSNVEEMDRQAGLILQQLEADGLLDKTIVFFYSDHGDGLPYVKREITDRGIRVPFIVRFPDKQNAGLVDDKLRSLIDVPPTLLSLAKVPIPAHFHGQAFLGQNTVNTPRKYVFAARDRMDSEYDRVRSVRDARFQYLRNYFPEKPYYQDVKFRLQQPMMAEMIRLRDAGRLSELQMRWFRPKGVREELYDLDADPHQFHNLADRPEHAAKLLELRTALDDWANRYGDLGDLSEREMIERQWPGGVQPVTAAPQIRQTQRRCRITCTTPGASIVYKIIKGKQPEPEAWQLYTKHLILAPGERVKAVATRIGYAQSEAVEQ